MPVYAVHFWKQVPFFRLLLPFMAGIILQWRFGFSLTSLLTGIVLCGLTGLMLMFLPSALKYRFRWLQGLCIQIMMLVAGACITYKSDIRNNYAWAGNFYTDSAAVVATLQEPLVEKAKSYKALATIDAIKTNNGWQKVRGNMLIYFRKDSTIPSLRYGSEIIFVKPLQRIKNSGNPGAFNYQRYAAFQDIYHQVFLNQNEYVATGNTNINPFNQWLLNIRFNVVNTLKQYIPAEKEAGVAEALLIGYKDDLDKNLVQAYSNTGVVHIIAISGLHLGLIYLLLVWVFNRFKRRSWVKWVKPVVIICVLWIFSLVAGAAPSILRSAVMFTCIVIGETISRKGTVYNTLAVSAFILLFYNPYFLWDVGFQLSYAAVLSILIFMRPVYNWFYVPNKALNFVWELTSITISAQILTLPFILYHFHQFANLFLITNLVAVPLSTFVLYGELLLIIFSKVPVIAKLVGTVTYYLLAFMNGFIERLNNVSFAITENIQLSLAQAVLLSIFLSFTGYWLLRKSKPALLAAIFSAVFFVGLRSYDIYEKKLQRKIIVYNVPQHEAIDFVNGMSYTFYGDTALLADDFLRNFHLKPARTLYRTHAADHDAALQILYPFFQFGGKKILIIDQPFKFSSPEKIPVDMIVLSKNPRVYIADLLQVFDCKQFVFDASNSMWKINQWKKDCENLHLRHHSTPDNGAFEMEL